MATRLVVKITYAQDDPERAHIGMTVAATAVASGLDVQVFLAAEGVNLALREGPQAIDVPEGAPIGELIDAVYAGATVTVCTPCAKRRGLAEDDFRSGTAVAGAAKLVELLSAEGATALVY